MHLYPNCKKHKRAKLNVAIYARLTCFCAVLLGKMTKHFYHKYLVFHKMLKLYLVLVI